MCMGRVETAVLFVPLRKIEQRKRSEMKPAIRKDRHSGDIPALVRTQHQHRAADILLGIPDITQGNGLEETTAELRVSLLMCSVGGAQSCWSDAIDPNAKSTQFPTGRPRQPTQRLLCDSTINEHRLD